MPINQLKSDLPEFDIPEQYKADTWAIKEWAIYTQATEKQQHVWDIRSSATDGKLDFTLCNNLYIREELKYVMYSILETGINVSTLGNNYDYLKNLCKYINDTKKYNSLVNFTQSSYASYYSIKLRRKVIVKSSATINKNMEKIEQNKTNKGITFLNRCIKILNDYYNRELPILERDVWRAKHMKPINPTVKTGIHLDFTDIPQKSIKQNAKEFCLFKLGSCDNSTVCKYLLHIRNFAKWLFNYDPAIIHLSQLNRDIMEDYFFYLRIELDCSDHYANLGILQLKAFFETLMILECDNIPENFLILPTDYTFKSKKEAKYYTPEESQNITNVMKYMEKTDAKIVFCLKILGSRISELLDLKPSSVYAKDDNSYYLKIYQPKVKREYIKVLPPQVSDLILSEINKNRRKYNCEPEYVFLSEEGSKILYSSFTKRLNRLFYDHQVKDRNGNLLRFQTHRFRATVATNLVNAGYGAKQTAEILGQSSLESLTHYIHIHDETVIKQLAPRLAKDDALIRNIGLMDKISPETIKTTYTPLCNGWCIRDVSNLGVCKKANSCLTCGLFKPSIEFLNNYEMQLQDVLATIEIARANDMEVLLKKNLKLKEDLERIIRVVKEKLE